MHRIFFLIPLLLLANALRAQEQVTKADSVFTERADQLHSISSSLTHKTDTLQYLVDKPNEVVDSINTKVSTYNHTFDSIRNNLTHRIDSLNALQLPTAKYTRLLDSLNRVGPGKMLSEAQHKVAGVESKISKAEGKINAPATRVEQKVNEKLNLMRSKGGEGANLPGNVDLPGVNGPDTPGIPGVPGIEVNMPAGNTGLNLSEPGGSAKIPALGELNKAQGSLGEIGSVTGQVAGYGADAKNIASGNLDEVKQLPTAAENKAAELADLQGMQKQTQVIDGYKDMVGKGNDPKALLKEQAKLQAPKLAKNHFKGQEAVLQDAMDKMTKLKKKYTQLTDLKNLPKHKPNAMKGKPLVERLIPGILLQIQKSDNAWLDYGVTLGYLISGRLTTGLGWNERIAVTSKFSFTDIDRVYGPRTYLDFKFKKGISLRTDVEKMYTLVKPNPLNPNPSDLPTHAWAWGVFVGMKKEYQFVKSVKGNFQFLYNIYNDHGNSPYTTRLNVRFGFDFSMKRKEAKPKALE